MEFICFEACLVVILKNIAIHEKFLLSNPQKFSPLKLISHVVVIIWEY